MKFFKADNGSVGIRAILPTVEGEQVKAAINEACNAAWRATHPERAENVGAHDDEPREQRLADALVALVTGEASGSCRSNCHPHRHETGANITRQSDGAWTVDGKRCRHGHHPNRKAQRRPPTSSKASASSISLSADPSEPASARRRAAHRSLTTNRRPRGIVPSAVTTYLRPRVCESGAALARTQKAAPAYPTATPRTSREASSGRRDAAGFVVTALVRDSCCSQGNPVRELARKWAS